MRLSYSSISTYRTCPLQYKFIEVDRMPRKRTAALDFGSSLHSALQFLYSMPEPPAPGLDEVLANLEKVWENEGYENEVEEKRYFEQAKQVLTDYYRKNIDGKDFLVPLAVEHYFRIPFEDIEVSGRIDRVDKLPDGTYEIVDYKTNRRLPDLIQLEGDLQLSMYHWAAEATWGITPDKLTFYFLLHSQSLTTSRRPEQIERAQETVRQTLAAIKGGVFEPKKNPLCSWCDFQDQCPLFSGRAEPEPTEPHTGRLFEV